MGGGGAVGRTGYFRREGLGEEAAVQAVPPVGRGGAIHRWGDEAGHGRGGGRRGSGPVVREKGRGSSGQVEEVIEDRRGGGGGLEPKCLCTKNGPNPHFFL